MSVDVIIPVYKPDVKFYRLLKMLYCQTVIPKQVIIMNTVAPGWSMEELRHSIGEAFSGDENASLRQKLNLKLVPVRKEEFDHSLTRYYAAKMSDAEFVLFMTQDAVPKDGTLVEKLLGACKDGAGAAFARQISYDGGSLAERCSREYNYPPKSYIRKKDDIEKYGIKAIFSSDVCMMYERKRFVMLGGFGEKTVFSEEMSYAYKLLESGGTLAYVADAEVYHSHDYTLKEQFRRNFDIGANQSNHPEIYMELSSEKEGMRYIGAVLKKLGKRGKIAEGAGFIVECGFKYAGYLLGKNYKKFSKDFVMRCTGSPVFFENMFEEGKGKDIKKR